MKRTRAATAANKGWPKAVCHLLAQLVDPEKTNITLYQDSRSQRCSGDRADVTQPSQTDLQLGQHSRAF